LELPLDTVERTDRQKRLRLAEAVVNRLPLFFVDRAATPVSALDFTSNKVFRWFFPQFLGKNPYFW